MPFNKGDEVEVVATSDDLHMVGIGFRHVEPFTNYSCIGGIVTFYAEATGAIAHNWRNSEEQPITLVQIRSQGIDGNTYWLPEHCVMQRASTPQRRALRMFKEKYNAARV
jgi:hypothetical protein